MVGHADAEERLANDPRSELWGEHRSRYHFAARWAAGNLTLDLACGAGLGLPILSQAGARVIGLDHDLTALSGARTSTARSDLAQVDGLQLPFAACAIDVVVSFETLEHVPDADRFLDEVVRVLRPDGTLILSTPNRAFGPASLHENNPFHVREFAGDELEQMLLNRFRRVQLHGQWVRDTYRFVPYLLVDPRREPRALAWKLMNRLPYPAKEALAQCVSQHSFYPGESDYRFLPGVWRASHALIAVAHGPRGS
jgi:SAM-dependent methyltransferase